MFEFEVCGPSWLQHAGIDITVLVRLRVFGRQGGQPSGGDDRGMHETFSC